jgi:hypothetical protein
MLKQHTPKMYGDGKVRLHAFLLSALNRSGMSTLYPGHSRSDRHHSRYGQCPNDITIYVKINSIDKICNSKKNIPNKYVTNSDSNILNFRVMRCSSIALHVIRCTTSIYLSYQVKGKGNSIPLQAWTGPEGSRRLRLLDFKTISA